MGNEARQADDAINFATMCACFNIRKAARAVSSFYDAVLRPTGLRNTQATMLMVIASVSKPPTISQIAEAAVMDRTTVARELKPLVAQDLVRIVPGVDRRTREVYLTDAGHAKRREIIPLWKEAQSRLIAEGLGQRRWSKLYDDLQDVVRITQA